MEIRFYNSPETGLPHCLDHGVRENEVIEVFDNSPLKLHGHDKSYLALGKTDGGRHLKVIYRLENNGNGIFVITAYDLRGKALAAYRKRRRRKG